MAVGDSDTIRAGAALMVTAPLPAVTVTGYALALGLDPRGRSTVLDELLEPQPASRAGAATASTPTTSRIFIPWHFLPGGGGKAQ